MRIYMFRALAFINNLAADDTAGNGGHTGDGGAVTNGPTNQQLDVVPADSMNNNGVSSDGPNHLAQTLIITNT